MTLVLLVEDEETLRAVEGRYLRRAGFEVREAADGVAGVAAALREPHPDVVLMDIMLPSLNGVEAARRIHADPRGAAIPIIGCTGAVLGSLSVESAGFVTLLQKPFPLTTLMAAIRDAAATRQGPGLASAPSPNPSREEPVTEWQRRLIDDAEGIARIWGETRRVAVLGIKTEAQAGQPAFYVPEYLQSAGLEVVPVPVYFPNATTILGEPVHRKVADVPGPLDMVVVFRRSADVPAHVDDLIAARPRTVWMQSGIAHPEAARRLAEAGIQVVQDRCTMVEHRRHAR